MAEAIILPVAKSILGKLASFAGDAAITHVAEEIKAAKSAKKDLKIIADKMEAICAVLHDAEKKQFTNEAMKLWLRDLKNVVYDIDDLLDEVAFDALLRKTNEGHFRRQLRYYLSSSNPIISRFHLSRKIKDLREMLENIVNKKNDFGLTERPVELSRDSVRDPLDASAYVFTSAVVGRDEAKQDVIRRLESVNDVSELSVLAIVGMGGIGKTTLAKLVYHDVQHFDLKLWVCVSDTFRISKIIEDILKDGSGDCTPNQDMSILVKKLHSLLSGKKYLLVLDDVWVEDFAMWVELKNVLAVGNPGSVILITTRNSKVASITQTFESYNLDCLPVEVCWSIFKHLAFKEGEEDKYPNLCEIGRSIVNKCHGIPLVVKTLGSLLRVIRDEQEWKRIENMDNFAELNQQYGNVLPLLKLSYDKLSSDLKPCFAYMSLFMKNADLNSHCIPYIWTALSLLPSGQRNEDIEDLGYSSLIELSSKSLIELDECIHMHGLFCTGKMHDLFHDLAVNILEGELAVVTSDKMSTDLDFARHIVWGDDDNLDTFKDKEFPIKVLKAKKARTFRFGCEMKQYVSTSFLENIISNFSCLRILEFSSLWFEGLPKSIGNLKHLRCLCLSGNPIIKSLPNTICDLLNLEMFDIQGCEQLKELPIRDIHQLQNLKSIEVTFCQVSLVDTKFIKLSSLQSLAFISCKRLISLWDNDTIGNLNSLRSLLIKDCPKLTSLPNSLKYLVGLRQLHIQDCEDLDMKQCSLEGLQGLRILSIYNVNMASLPNGIQSAAASLQSFVIMNCGSLVDLPDCFHCFTSLRIIGMANCPNVLRLPKSLCQLTSLQQLGIGNCPHLSKRFAVPGGEDYSLIRHIPAFFLDGVAFTPNQSH